MGKDRANGFKQGQWVQRGTVGLDRANGFGQGQWANTGPMDSDRVNFREGQ